MKKKEKYTKMGLASKDDLHEMEKNSLILQLGALSYLYFLTERGNIRCVLCSILSWAL
jgi:hypothetical protein